MPNWTIRVLALLIVAACVAGLIFAALPGTQIVRDRNRCSERPVARLAVTHNRPDPPCVRDYVSEGTRPAGSATDALVLVIFMVGAGLVAWFARPLGALGWSVSTWVASLVYVVATLDFDLGDWSSAFEGRSLWPSAALSFTLVGIYKTLFVLGVVGVVAHVREVRARAPQEPTLPRAVLR